MARPRTRRRERRNVPHGRAYIYSTFNNTLISITDPQGSVIASASAGTVGFKGSRKGTAFAAQRAGEQVARRGMDQGLRQVDVMIKGPGAGREAAPSPWSVTPEDSPTPAALEPHVPGDPGAHTCNIHIG